MIHKIKAGVDLVDTARNTFGIKFGIQDVLGYGEEFDRGLSAVKGVTDQIPGPEL